MNDIITRTIHLSKDDAVNFANSLFRPTQREIENHREQLDKINRNVTIRRTEDGFIADVADLDLFFLEEKPLETTFNVTVTLKVKSETNIYYDSKKKIAKETIVVKTSTQYTSSKDDNFSPWAA